MTCILKVTKNKQIRTLAECGHRHCSPVLRGEAVGCGAPAYPRLCSNPGLCSKPLSQRKTPHSFQLSVNTERCLIHRPIQGH